MITISNSGIFLNRPLRSVPEILRQVSSGANFWISFSQLNTTVVGQITSVGIGPSTSLAFWITVSAWSVLPRPISSARIPLSPYLYINQSQPKPFCWYSRNSALIAFGNSVASVVENVDICDQKASNSLLKIVSTLRFLSSLISPAR